MPGSDLANGVAVAEVPAASVADVIYQLRGDLYRAA